MYYCTHCHVTDNDKRGWYFDGIGGQYCQDCMDQAIRLLDEEDDARKPADISQEVVDQITDALARTLIDEALHHAVSERNAPIWPGKPTIPLHYATTPPIWPVAPHYDFGLRCPTCGAYPGHYMTCAARDGAPRMV